MYLAVLRICNKVFDADSGDGICFSQKYAIVNKGDLKEIVKAESKNSGHPTSSTSEQNSILCKKERKISWGL